ncbi:hypothetical protein Poly30_01660 [Planctomycetes bacterium Poly30]|uniref:DUF2780 domain-containing protein n=1 Tax=Saltatorellus ferox TaxID=2528018 RepID=A0A518EKQ4_9BACT|nr:hypothetical protein Poly30_01660 [Planctomycetes bacterium Poly30]
MSNSILRALPALLLSLLAGFSFTGCASTGALSGPLANALGEITGFSTNIADWQSKLGGMVDGTALGQLKEYADKATNLGDTVKGMAATATKAMQNPLEAIGSKLSDMGGINVDQLKSLAPSAQMDAIKGFTGSAENVGAMAQDFLKQFGN